MRQSVNDSFNPPSRQAQNIGSYGRRHCWECRRRCLVCDSEVPGCKRCCASGIHCPGYGDVKPTRLRWITPGRVTSRDQKQKKILLGEKQDNDVEIKNQSMPTIEIGICMPISRFEMNKEAHVIVQALEYFNCYIYQDLVPIHDLGQNPYIYPLSTRHLQAAVQCPDYLKYGMLCMILSHRINQTRGMLQTRALVEKFYLYWGLAVQSLNEYLGMKDKRVGDTVIAGVLTLLLSDVQQGTSLNWRCHLEAVYKLIMLRGGFYAVIESPSMEPLLLCFWFVTVIGNTTCPASNLFMTALQLDALNFLPEKYSSAVSPFQLCPVPMFIEIIKINHLRMQATRPDAFDIGTLQKEGYEVLERIHCFSPQQLAESKHSSQEDWRLVGEVYQAAVALYCTLSLQSLSILPEAPALRTQCATHGRTLQMILRVTLASKKLKRFMIWPLVLLGVEAVHGGAPMRAFVAKQLSEISQDVGTYVPLTAKRVLEHFWASGETRWDVCFARPYVFTMQIAVDTSRLMPLYK
ncbi:fungal-specific transcription factor domain-containing protein [Trichoderma barbatum]